MKKYKGISYRITNYNLRIVVDMYQEDELVDTLEFNKATFIGEQDIDNEIKEHISENY